MPSSFAGHTFYERGDAGLNVPFFDAKFSLAVKIIPNGSPVVQAIGRDVQRLAMPIRCDVNELADLFGDIDGDAHTLEWTNGPDSAILESIDTPLEVKPDANVFFTTLHFIRL